MTWEEVWKIILCAVGSAGGIGAIIVMSIKWSANIIANHLSKKYEAKVTKELEKYKTGLENKIYISKTKFDVEFALYRDLSKSFFTMVKDITRMIPAGLAYYPANKEDREKYENELYDKALVSTVSAQDYLSSNIPFIPESLYNQYEEILQLCRLQLGEFEERWNVYSDLTQEDKNHIPHEAFQRSREIREKFDHLNKDLRNYLSNLDVIE